jgi:F0F1-type ATP synthase epsilon subunit
MDEPLRLVIRTPHEILFDAPVRGARVPTGSGQVGLRRREEPMLLVLEPGLVLIAAVSGPRYAATAGGLLEAGRERAILYTPFAALGADADEVLGALERALATPDSELSARRQIAELEQRITHELRRSRAASQPERAHGPA